MRTWSDILGKVGRIKHQTGVQGVQQDALGCGSSPGAAGGRQRDSPGADGSTLALCARARQIPRPCSPTSNTLTPTEETAIRSE